MMFRIGDRVKTNVAYEYWHRHSIIGVVTKIERNLTSNTVFITVKCDLITGQIPRHTLINNEIILVRNDLQLLKQKK